MKKRAVKIGFNIGLFLFMILVSVHFASASTQVSGTYTLVSGTYFINISYHTGTNNYNYKGHTTAYATQDNLGGNGNGSCDTYTSGICAFRISFGGTNPATAYPHLWYALADFGTDPDISVPYYAIGGAIPADGVGAQFTPAPSSTVPYYVSFTGTYNNSAFFGQICAEFTTTDADVAPFCATLPSINGVGLPYSFNYSLSPNHTYSYTLHLHDSLHNTDTTTTSPISFSTSGLIAPSPVWTPETCDWTSPSTYGGCLDNVFHDMFTPSAESLNGYTGLITTMQTKVPFGYISSTIDDLKGLNDTGTSVFTLHSLPILNTLIFDPIRSALVWVLWVAFVFVLFHRFKNIHL
jgi:hypothetical protein